MLRSYLFALTAGAALLACDPYAPDLSDKPFSCVAPDNDCPEGYAPDTSGGGCVCVRDGAGGGDDKPDAASASCTIDQNLEPNDSLTGPFATPVGNGAQTAMFDAVVCTQADVDLYSFVSSKPMAKMVASAQFDPQATQLTLAVTDPSGIMVGMGTMQGNNLLIANVTLPTTGTYYVKVASTSGQGAYKLNLSLQ
jgi:hypothetical protein